MLTYLLRRLGYLVITVFIVVTLVFFAFRLAPGDPAQLIAGQQTRADVERVREYLGLGDPVLLQYGKYLRNILHGKLGVSAILQVDVSRAIMQKIPATLALVSASMALTILLGIPLGVMSAVRSRSVYDYIIIVGVVVLLAIPNFWLGLLLMSFFSVKLRWLPTFGFSGLASLIMPCLAVSARLVAIATRMTRSSMLEVIQEEYVRVARSKGLAEKDVIYRHALRSALIPVATELGLQMGYLVGGSIVIEVLFGWPGIGHLLINAINMRDYSLVQGITVVYVAGFLIINVVVDMLYVYMDPRIRYKEVS